MWLVWKGFGITVPVFYLLGAWIVSFFYPESDKVFYSPAMPWSFLFAGILLALQGLMALGGDEEEEETEPQGITIRNSFFFIPVGIWGIGFLGLSIYLFIV